jgi:hypothetical protein
MAVYVKRFWTGMAGSAGPAQIPRAASCAFTIVCQAFLNWI